MSKKTYAASYYRKNKAKFRESHRRWREKNKEKRNGYMREYKRKRLREDPKWREKQRQEARYYYRKHRAKAALYDKRHQNTLKVLARRAVFIALDGGKLTKPVFCEICGKKCSPQAHHPDYGKPLSVIWVCTLCHGKFHQKH